MHARVGARIPSATSAGQRCSERVASLDRYGAAPRDLESLRSGAPANRSRLSDYGAGGAGGGGGAAAGGGGGGGTVGSHTHTYCAPLHRSSYRPCGYCTTVGLGAAAATGAAVTTTGGAAYTTGGGAAYTTGGGAAYTTAGWVTTVW